MLSKKARFTRSTFPKKRPDTRQGFSWGTVNVYFNEGAPRASVVVPKKVLKHAHDRNRATRRVYEALTASGALVENVSLVVFPRREALTTPFSILSSDIKSAAHR